MEKNKEKIIERFKIFGPATILYSFIFVYCLYKNWAGITSPIWAIATLAYIIYISKKFEKKWRGINTFFSVAIILLGFSNFITANGLIIFFNYIAIIILVIFNMIYLFVDKRGGSVVRYIEIIFLILGGMIEKVYRPFEDLFVFFKQYKPKKTKNIVYTIVGFCIAIPLALVLLKILSSADVVFDHIIVSFTEKLKFEFVIANFMGIITMLTLGYMIPYLFSSNICIGEFAIKEGKILNAKPIIPIIITATISFVYGLFSIVQIVYLFMKKGMLPEGYTYAQYAREGFFQLLVICIFNIIVILICLELFKENWLLKLFLTVISVCTFIMIASSAYRMNMYIGEYGLTTIRVLVLWSLVVIFLLMLGYFCRIFVSKIDMVKYSVVVVTICFTVLSLSRMDAYIAGYNINLYSEIDNFEADHYYEIDNYVDYSYVFGLSADAAPVVMKHMNEIEKQMKANDSWVGKPEWCKKKYKGYLTHYNFVTIRKINLSNYWAKYSVEEYKNSKEKSGLNLNKYK